MKPTQRTIIAGIAVLALIAGTVIGYQRLTSRRASVRYITQSVTYADIASSVTETGTVSPVDEVQVGTQVSGTIEMLNVDYNSRVKKGQVLATLDQTSFQAAVDQASAALEAAQATAAADQSAIAQAASSAASAAATLQQQQQNLVSAQANLSKAQAQMKLSQLTVQRDRQLLAQGYIAQNQMDTDQTTAQGDAEGYRAAQAAVGAAQAQAAAAAAQLQAARQQISTATAQAAAAQHQASSAAAQLQMARYNLSRTVIMSPVDGIVLARNVSIGQTVAASFQTPTLFMIATNLTDMQVDTSVDEADVGHVRHGEAARISVTAYPNVTFQGTVQQVRVNPTVVQNVVTYDAVIAVHDTSGRLLPGMTAQVSIDTGTHTHVLAVPTAALLFRPLAQRSAPNAAPGGVVVFGAPATTADPAVTAPVAGAPGSRVTVWALRNNRPVAVSVIIGLSDSRNVEITSGNLEQGDPVIIAQVRGGQGRQGGTGAGGQGGPGRGQGGEGG